VAKTLRRTTFRGHHYMEFEPQFKKLPPWDATTLWFYKELTDTSVLRLSQKLDIPAFREEIGVDVEVSQPTLHRIDERADDGQGSQPSQYFLDERDRVLRLVDDTPWGDAFVDPPEPEVETDGATEPDARLKARRLRNEVYPYIQFQRDASNNHPKHRLLKLLDIAGNLGIFPNQAAGILTGKDWLRDINTPEAQDLFYHIRKLPRSKVTDMFVAANERLFEIAQQYDDFTSNVEIAVDISDWPWFGENKPRYTSGTKPGRNYAYAWQFITLGIVGTHAPVQLVALPVQNRKNKAAHLRRLLKFANTHFDIDRAYLDSAFYSAKVTSALLDNGVDFVMQSRMRQGVMTDLVEEAADRGDTWASMPFGVKDRNPTEYMMMIEAEKRASRRKGAADEVADNWTPFYTNLDPEEHGAHELARGYRNRWGVETSCRVIKEDFLPKSGSETIVPRHFIFNYAVTMYNSWVVANLIAASERDHDLDESKVFKAATYMALICDDSKKLTEQEIDDISEVSDMVGGTSWF